MKRILSALLTLAIAGSLLTACGEKTAPQTPDRPPEVSALPPAPESIPAVPESKPDPKPESAPEPAPAPSSVQENSVPTTPEVPTAQVLAVEPNGFAFDEADVQRANVYRYADQTAVRLYSWELLPILEQQEPVTDEEIGERISGMDEMMIVLTDDTKYTYTLYEEGVAVAVSPPGGDAGAPVRYRLNPEHYGDLQALAAKQFAQSSGLAASWMNIMRESRTESATVTKPDGTESKTYQNGAANFQVLFHDLREIDVKPATLRKVDTKTLFPDAARIDIQFVNGIRYQVQLNGTSMLIASSDMDYALLYELTSEYTIDNMLQMAEGKIVPNTGKPVIYLYPEKPTDVSVKVRYKGEFFTTFPAYGDGWNVTAHPDGRLVNKPDGTEHYYLFWDGVTDKRWSFDEGFCVAGKDSEAFLREKLALLGLTPREYNDFIVFWLPEMQQNDYNLVTFATEEYEDLAQMEITPAPDSLLRVHMVFKGLDAPVEIPTQTLQPFTRNGFAVVEWGGSRA